MNIIHPESYLLFFFPTLLYIHPKVYLAWLCHVLTLLCERTAEHLTRSSFLPSGYLCTAGLFLSCHHRVSQDLNLLVNQYRWLSLFTMELYFIKHFVTRRTLEIYHMQILLKMAATKMQKFRTDSGNTGSVETGEMFHRGRPKFNTILR